MKTEANSGLYERKKIIIFLFLFIFINTLLMQGCILGDITGPVKVDYVSGTFDSNFSSIGDWSHQISLNGTEHRILNDYPHDELINIWYAFSIDHLVKINNDYKQATVVFHGNADTFSDQKLVLTDHYYCDSEPQITYSESGNSYLVTFSVRYEDGSDYALFTFTYRITDLGLYYE